MPLFVLVEVFVYRGGIMTLSPLGTSFYCEANSKSKGGEKDGR